MANRISAVQDVLTVDGKTVTGDATGVYVFGGYKVNDADKNSYADSVNFDEIEVYGVTKVITDIELGKFHYKVDKLSSQDVPDFMPELSTGSSSESTGATSPELLAIEQEKLALEKERREEEKIAHKQLHSEELVTRTDIMGNVEEQVEGYYPAVRSHKVLEASETQYGVNSYRLMEISDNADRLDEELDKAGTDSLSEVVFDSEVEYEKIKVSVLSQFDGKEDGVLISKEAWERYKGTFVQE